MKYYSYLIDYMFEQPQYFQWQRLYDNVAVCIFVQSEEECSLIWKATLLTIQTDKSKW